MYLELLALPADERAIIPDAAKFRGVSGPGSGVVDCADGGVTAGAL